MQNVFILISALALAAGPDEAPSPWAANTHPSDVPKSHVEEITAGQHKYTVVQGGTMDGRNCRSPMGCGIAQRGGLPPNLGVQPLGADGERGRDRRRQSVALQRPQ